MEEGRSAWRVSRKEKRRRRRKTLVIAAFDEYFEKKLRLQLCLHSAALENDQTLKPDPSRKSREPQNPQRLFPAWRRRNLQRCFRLSGRKSLGVGRFLSVLFWNLVKSGRFSRALNSSSGVSWEVNTATVFGAA